MQRDRPKIPKVKASTDQPPCVTDPLDRVQALFRPEQVVVACDARIPAPPAVAVRQIVSADQRKPGGGARETAALAKRRGECF